MFNWLKYLVANEEMRLLESYQTTLDEHRRMFAADAEISLVLENISLLSEQIEDFEVDDIIPCNPIVLRDKVYNFKKEIQDSIIKTAQTSLIKQLMGSQKDTVVKSTQVEIEFDSEPTDTAELFINKNNVFYDIISKYKYETDIVTDSDVIDLLMNQGYELTDRNKVLMRAFVKDYLTPKYNHAIK